ncbi:MAG TPA: ABC transporter permease, partial [Vicinamibacteria bacterium]|nr:ABC transporter permease [Vicinamibacteria bacterium]
MLNFMDDVRLAWRRLARSPTFTAVAVTTVALAIGANAAVFGLVDAVLFTRLPLARPDRIVRLWEERPSRGWTHFGVSALAFQDWQRDTRSFAHLAAYTRRSANLIGTRDPARVEMIECTAEMAEVLGLHPRRGRFFLPGEEARGRDRVAVLSHEFWKTAFGSSEEVVGRTITLDGVPHVVIGVLPAEASAVFDAVQIFRPLALAGDDRRGARWLEVIGRLADGATLETSRAELALLARRQERDEPETNTGWTATAVSYEEVRTEGARPLLLAVWAGVGLVLLVAAANVAGLVLARAAEREKELAVRAALGAPPSALARLVAMEGFVLAALGGAAGGLAALGARALLLELLGDVIDAHAAAPFGAPTLGFVVLTTAATGAAFALGPAWRARRLSLDLARKGDGRGGAGSRLRARRVLAVAEMAAAVVLLAGAGLLVRSVRGLLAVPAGFEPAGALAFRIAPPQSPPGAGQSEADFAKTYFAERDRAALLYARLCDALRGLPGVTVAGAVNRLPLTGRWWSISISAGDQPPPPLGEGPSASGRVITPGYFDAMGMALRAGRRFTDADSGEGAPVAIVSESLAKRTWPGQDAIGRPLVVDRRSGVTVVGVVADARVDGLDEDPPPIVY